MAPRAERLLKSIAVSLVGVGIVVFFVNLKHSVSRTSTPSAPPALIRYSPNTICPDAFNEDLDYSKRDVRYFDVQLHEGCFGGFVHIPHGWKHWYDQPIGDQRGYWMAIWIANEQRGRGPFFANEDHDLTYNVARFQGHGTIRLYTNVDVPPSTMPPKPDELGVYKSGGAVSPPVILSKVEPTYTPDARAAHWSGTVSATVVVDEDGSIGDIRITNSPGYGLDEKVIEALHQWKFRPGELDGRAVPVRAKIDIAFRQL